MFNQKRLWQRAFSTDAGGTTTPPTNGSNLKELWPCAESSSLL